MHTQRSQARPAQIARKIAVACVFALSVAASIASSPPHADIIAGSADARPFTIDGSHKLQEFTVVVDANAAAVPGDIYHSQFDVQLTLTVMDNASGPAEIVIIPEAGVAQDPQPIRLGIARGEMRQAHVTAPGALDSCRSDETCTRGMTIVVKHVSGGAVTVAPSAHASIGWSHEDNAPKSAEIVVSYVDLEEAEPEDEPAER